MSSGSPATATPGSTCTPFQDRVYVTWTEFAPNGSAFIYEAYSADYGEHFSPRHLVSVSNDGGQPFTGTTTDPRALPSANTEAGQATTDQFWQWISFTKNGKLATSYYDRHYGDDETTGYSDISLSGSGDSPLYASWVVQRITNMSMPFPTQFPEGGNTAGGTFYGDYAGLDADTQAHPFWSDTRNPDLFACPGATPGAIALPPAVCGGQSNGTTLNDEDVYTANNAVPSK